MTKDYWLKSTLELISINGIDILKIDLLCKKLKVTKGSFYHHFDSYKDFIDAILEYWYQSFTVDVINKIQDYKDEPIKQIELLNDVIYSKDLNIEIEFRAFSLRNKEIKNYIEKIDMARIEVIQNIQTHLNPRNTQAECILISKYIYTQFIGSLFVQPRVTKDEQKELDNLFLNLLLKKENLC